MHHILVPTDLSEFATLALRYALRLQEKFGARITVLYADESMVHTELFTHPAGWYIENAPDEKLRMLTELHRYIGEHVRPPRTAEAMVVQDVAAHAIVEAARHLRADLVVMATHGRSGWRRALLGSVTESVMRHIDTPLLTVTPERMPRRALWFDRVLCVSRDAMEKARAIADAFGAELVLLPVRKASAEAILRAAEASHADLIVTGGAERLIVRNARCAVLTHASA